MTPPRLPRITPIALVLLATSGAAQVAQQSPLQGDKFQPTLEVQTSPFPAPQPTDSLFVVDDSPGLDTGCTFSSGGPLQFDIDITRFVGDVAKLKAANMIGAQVVLTMPAFDVDSSAVVMGAAPEIDDVYLVNGTGTHFLGSLKGLNNTWILNTFTFPVEWLEFPPDPGSGNTLTPQPNTIRINIDVGNAPTEVWCTSIDWASIKIEATRPVLGVHGILSNGGIWTTLWQAQLQTSMGLPFDSSLNMGALDSIQSNAGKIGAQVAALRARWGVDKLTIVCHSKGGLDSRHYVENNDDVAKLIQLGTPNAGSPLADAAQAGLIAVQLLGGPSALLVNRLAGPAGIQLTQPYMALYNATHGHNANTQYVSLGGDYDPNCGFFSGFQCALFKTLLFITGPGDTIVPLTSAYALPYAASVGPYVSIGLGDTSATHSGLHQSMNVFNLLQGQVASTKGLTQRAVDPVRTVTEAGMLMTGQMNTFPVLVDDPGPASFTLLYPSGDMDLVLLSPTGVLHDQTTAMGNPNVVFGDGDILGGRSESFTFDTATETGTWMATVIGTSVTEPSGVAAYMVTALLQSSTLVLDGAFGPASVHLGDPLVVTGTLSNAGGPVLGATVTAGLTLPDSSTTTLTLLDDGLGSDLTAGDGIYTGALSTTTLAGVYDAAIRATDGTTFSREDVAMATVSNSASTITGPYSDSGLDTDGDGLFNELLLDVGVDILVARQYRLVGELRDSAGNTLTATLDGMLTAGVQTLQLSFDGTTLFKNQVDGPYEVTRLVLVEDSGTDMLPASEVLSPHFTTAYSWTAFEHDSLVLTGSGMDVGVDLNANGLFDLLHVDLDVLVEVPDNYTWTAILAAADGTDIELQTGAGLLAQGPGVISFDFTAAAFQAAGQNGPYMVKDLLVFGTTESLALTGAVYSTGFYCPSQFEGFSHVGPVFDPLSPCGSSYVLFPGDSLSLPFTASDTDCMHTTTLTASGLPPSATLTPPTPLSANPVGTMLDWSPSPGEEGHYDITLTASDDDVPGVMTSCTVGVDYTANVAPIFTGASPCGGSLSATVGEPISFMVEASDPNSGDVVTLSSATLPPRATATPALPASGVMVQVQVDWVPLCADVGPHVITFDLVDDSPFPLSAQCQVTINVLPATSTRVLRVDPGATGLANGATWSDAFPDLQSALDEAEACGSDTELWVAAGIYLPTEVQGLDPRSVSFSIGDGLRLYGGFAGGETSLSQRDTLANPTILSGDLNGDDLPGFLNVGDNAFHVVTFAATGAGTLLDGFRVSGGNAEGLFLSELRGGAVFVDGGAPTLRDVRFWTNRALDKGGAVYAESGASLVIDRCEFMGGSADLGGGLALVGSSAQLDTCTFVSNVAQTNGGGAYLEASSSIALLSTDFDGNSSNVGGGLSAKTSSGSMTGCAFRNNSAGLWGGGAAWIDSGPVTISGCSFDTNTADTGGGLLLDNSQGSVATCTFDGNSALNSGGGLGLQTAASFTVSGCSFNLNQATTQGGGVFVNGSTSTVSDGMFTSNQSGRGGGLAASQSGVTLERGMFVSNTATDSGGGVRVGTSSSLSVVGGLFSMNGANRGAGLQAVSSTLSVQGTAFADNTASAAGGAMELRTVTSSAIGQCDFDRNGSADGGALYITESSSPAVTDGNFRDNTASASGGAVSVLVNSQPSFTDCLFANNMAATSGGGMRVQGGSAATVAGCTFQGNTANRGGGVGNQDGGGSYTRCTFLLNGATLTGGAMDSRGASAPTVSWTSFVNNTAQTGGGCMVADTSAPIYESCRFIGNTTTQWAGAFADQSSGVSLLRNGLFAGNSAAGQGGAVRISSAGNLMMIGCTLGNNTAARGGGVYDDGVVAIQSSLLWGNSDNGGMDETAQVDLGPSAMPATGFASFTSVQGWSGAYGGLSNDGVDPLFVNLAGNDLHLSFGSPAVDAADPSYTPAPGELDADGEPRLLGAVLDRGADEQHDCNGNGILDYTEVPGSDCNENAIPDDCDIASGASRDSNGDGVPDECQLVTAPAGLQSDRPNATPRPSPGG